MRALVKSRAAPGLWMEDVGIAELSSNEVRIQICKTAICGTDVHIYEWDEWAAKTVPVPMVVGHEYAGVIVELGAAVKHLSLGQRVSGEGHVVTQGSRASRAGRFHLDPATRGVGVNLPGAFAEYLVLPAFNVVPLPDSIDDELGAILDPLGNAVHAALAYDLVGEDVLITGAGPIGIMAAAVARHVGARRVVVTDLNPYRLELLGQVCDARPVNIGNESLQSVMAQEGIREGFDVALEMSGVGAAFEQAVEHLIMGGKLALLGIPSRPTETDWSKIILKALELKGIYGRQMFETWYKMLAMLESGLAIRNVITHRFDSDDFEAGFETMRSGQSGKVILDWKSADSSQQSLAQVADQVRGRVEQVGRVA